MPRLSIVVPVYTEARRLAPAMQKLAVVLETFPFSHEVLLIVEKSGDASLAIAREVISAHPNWRAIDNQVHCGKGYAVRSGVAHAAPDAAFICFMDADLSSDPVAITDALALLENEPSVAIVAGDRRHPQSIVRRDQGKSRPFFSRLFNFTVRVFFPFIKTRDTQCGFKLFRAGAARAIFEKARIDGFAFDVEIFKLAHRLGYEVRGIPVRWTDAPHSTVRALRHGAQMFRDLLRLRFWR